MNLAELNAIANAIVENGKGVLAADESTPTIGKRFADINLESTEDNRRDYREMLFTTPGFSDYVGGVILYDETLRQNAKDGTPLSKVLQDQGVIPGIKVDMGAKPLAGFEDETITEGLDGLRDRLNEYYELGARFAKWRAVIDISDTAPTSYAVDANAAALARYAALCQEAGIVPIVEPEVLMDGDHDIDECEAITTEVLNSVFKALYVAEVELEGILLKPNMVIAGKKCDEQASAEEVAEATVRTLKRCVPSAVPGIVFLSGGQSEADATLHLDLMNKNYDLPWALSFSYGRALQASALRTWGGQDANVTAAKDVFAKRAKLNWMAANGEYSSDLEG